MVDRKNQTLSPTDAVLNVTPWEGEDRDPCWTRFHDNQTRPITKKTDTHLKHINLHVRPSSLQK